VVPAPAKADDDAEAAEPVAEDTAPDTDDWREEAALVALE